MNFSKVYTVISLISIYASTLLVLIGCFGCFISLLVFWHSKHKRPKIRAKDYLTILTIINSIYLLVYWYNYTTQAIIDVYEFRETDLVYVIFNFKNSNSFVCKIVNYTLTSTRSFSTMLTLMFSLERTMAIYFPLKRRRFSSKVNMAFIIVLIFLFAFCNLVSVENFYFYEIVKQNISHIVKDAGINIACDIPPHNKHTHDIVTFYTAIFTLFIPFLLIIFSNLAIVIRLNYTSKNHLSVKNRQSRQYSSTTIMSSLNINNNNNVCTNLINDDEANGVLSRNSTSKSKKNNNLSVKGFNHMRNESFGSDSSSFSFSNLGQIENLNKSMRSNSFDTISTFNNNNVASGIPEYCRNGEKSSAHQTTRMRRFFSLFRGQSDNSRDENEKQKAYANWVKLNKNNSVKVVVFKSNSSSIKSNDRPAAKHSISTLKNESSCSLKNGSIIPYNLNNGTTDNTNNTNIINSNQNNYLSRHSTVKIAASSSEKDLFLLRCANKKMPSIKVLIILTSFYIILNIPNFVNILLSKHNLFQSHLHYMENSTFAEVKYKYHIILLVTEIFYLCNFSVSALLLFASGKIYRRHLYGLTLKVANMFKRLKNFFICNTNKSF